MTAPIRYHLFGGYNYEMAGGMRDYCGSFDSPEDAAAYVRVGVRLDWWELARITPNGNLAVAYIWERSDGDVFAWRPVTDE